MGVCGFLISEEMDMNLKDDDVVMTAATHRLGIRSSATQAEGMGKCVER
jgi:hypothetical protein